MDYQNKESSQEMNYAGIGLAFGIVFGGLIGSLIGSPIIFAGGTMVLGFAIGAAMYKRSSSNGP